ncbi:MAG: hypothetical protein KatS3mg131_3990 [Candidatus Tectimicrobiota bacterium]|nr:MAG: hypothetical protein KatS3mg131_3990 [Candidatus Tectomicrobia bacterium]
MVQHTGSQTTTPAERQEARQATWYQEGVVAGTLGAVTIALWFLILDALGGRPLYTPNVLGHVVLKGLRDGAALQDLPLSLDVVVGFTFVHWLIFAALGGAAAYLLKLAEQNPNLGFGVLLLFVVFESGFLAAEAVFAWPLSQVLPWRAVLAGNFLAAAAMALYFWQRHRHMVVNP